MGWNQRHNDDIFRTLPSDCRPLNPPLQEEYNRQILDSSEWNNNEYARLLGEFLCDNTNHHNQLKTLQQKILEWKPQFINCLKIKENLKNNKQFNEEE